MNMSARFHLVLMLFVLTVLFVTSIKCTRDVPGAIELVGYNSRKPRTSGEPFEELKHLSLPLEKEKADIETVKQNIDAYNQLMSVDTKKLSRQQKDLLDRIVERVARLKSVLDAPKIQNKENVSTETTSPDDFKPTTPFSTQKSANVSEQESTTAVHVTTTQQDDQTEARANNNSGSSLSKSHADSKHSIRQTTTPKSSTGASATTKRSSVVRLEQKLSSAMASTTSDSATSTGGPSRGNSASAAPPQQPTNIYNKRPTAIQETSTDKQQQQQTPENSEVADESTSTVNVGEPITPDLSFTSNETASSIIDTLANHAREDYYTKGSLPDDSKVKKPTATAKPTKYHYYPHNQHIYLLPECAIQQVCNAVYVRLNYTQPLCACPSRYRDPCSASLNEDDQHTTKLIGNSKKKAITLAKTCETTTEMRECRSPKDWSLLALQNTRTGKSHYLVICRCPDYYKLEGPMAHDQPTYASVPGIRVFGMMCVRPGYSVRKPSVQPPKRYQLQKPFYVATSSQYSSNKDTRPGYQDDSYQNQYQANYQYLNRPETSSIINISNAQDFVDSISLNSFDGIYGRNNIKKDEATNEKIENSKREKRFVAFEDDPPFPIDRLVKFQSSLSWD